VLFVDAVDEEKHWRLQLEQIKSFSRSMYDYQNQMNKYKSEINASACSTMLVSRFVNTLRQSLKVIRSYTEIYPYMCENRLISSKLTSQFQKQFCLTIQHFIAILNLLGGQLTRADAEVIKAKRERLNELLIFCERLFIERSIGDEEATLALVKRNEDQK
jgi:hypothetical protein